MCIRDSGGDASTVQIVCLSKQIFSAFTHAVDDAEHLSVNVTQSNNSFERDIATQTIDITVFSVPVNTVLLSVTLALSLVLLFVGQGTRTHPKQQ